MKIEVTQVHIDNGVQRMMDACPVARAAVYATGAYCRVDKDCLHVHRAGGRTAAKFLLPSEALHFVNSYDAGEEVAPFEFEIDYEGK